MPQLSSTWLLSANFQQQYNAIAACNTALQDLMPKFSLEYWNIVVKGYFYTVIGQHNVIAHAIQDLMPKFSLEYWNIVEKGIFIQS